MVEDKPPKVEVKNPKRRVKNIIAVLVVLLLCLSTFFIASNVLALFSSLVDWYESATGYKITLTSVIQFLVIIWIIVLGYFLGSFWIFSKQKPTRIQIIAPMLISGLYSR